MWYLLTLLFFLSKNTPNSYAQMHNGEIYRKLIQTYFSQNNSPIKRIQGQPLIEWLPTYQIDSLASRQLIFSPAIIKYERLAKSSYVRNISVRLTLQDSTVQSVNQSYSDTLDTKSFKKIYKNSPYELKGDNPIFLKKWGLPIAIISGSIVGVIALFFVRSQ